MEHYIRGQKVFTTTKIRLKSSGAPVKEGYLAIQAEGTPTLFRKLEILDLVGCMDKTKPAYRSYFVKSVPGACEATRAGALQDALPGHASLVRDPDGFTFRSSRPGILEVADPAGRIISRNVVSAGLPQSLAISRKGLCLVTWRSEGATSRIKWMAL